MKLRSVGKTHVGMKRPHNEDSHLVDDDLGLYLVADGMGGHAAGEIASAEAISTAHDMITQGAATLRHVCDPLDEAQVHAVRRLMESAVQAATYMVYSLAELDREKSGMGTTITGMLCVGELAVIGHVGDSRVYRYRGGDVLQLTEDHTLIAWQLREGIITQDEARKSPHKNVITRAVGNRDYVQVDTSLVDLRVGDRYVLCTDGLHNYVKTSELPAILQEPLSAAAERLIALANERGGKDNITVVIVEVCE